MKKTGWKHCSSLLWKIYAFAEKKLTTHRQITTRRKGFFDN